MGDEFRTNSKPGREQSHRPVFYFANYPQRLTYFTAVNEVSTC